MIRTFRITVLVEEINGPNEPALVVAQSRGKHYVDERSLHSMRFPCDWLRAELEIPLKRASQELAPPVYKHLAPETTA